MHIYTTHIAGWKPLGREFLVTKAQNALLFELDGKPAYDVYYRYLKILNDEHFFFNTLEFPFFYKHNGIDILRAPVHCNEDGTLVMTSDIDENVKARLAYGDPWTILDCVRRDEKKLGRLIPISSRSFPVRPVVLFGEKKKSVTRLFRFRVSPLHRAFTPLANF